MKELKEGSELELKIYGEICCDDCNDIIHNHLDCPVCKKDYAGSDQYIDLYDEEEISCEVCGTVYEFIGNGRYSDSMVRIKTLGSNHINNNKKL